MTVHAFGFDVGGTQARAALFEFSPDATYAVCGQVSERIRGRHDMPQVLATLARQAAGLAADHGLLVREVQAAGLGLAAQLRGPRILRAPNLGWPEGTDVVAALSEALGSEQVHVVVENDLNALAWGELVHGGVGGQDVLAVYVGTGVGGAVISGGALVRGAGGIAGEIGHMKVEVGGKLCGCGERGCVEAYAGGVHLERDVSALATSQAFPESWGIVTENGEVDLAAADRRAGECERLGALWEGATQKLAMCVANACTLLNPQSLLMGGGVWTHCPEFRSRTLQGIQALMLQGARENVRLVEPQVPEIAGMLGAASLALGGRQNVS